MVTVVTVTITLRMKQWTGNVKALILLNNEVQELRKSNFGGLGIFIVYRVKEPVESDGEVIFFTGCLINSLLTSIKNA